MVATLIQALINVLLLAIFGKIILSWFLVLGMRNDFVLTLYRATESITEPLLRPLRRVVPAIGMIDLTPMVAVIILIVIQNVVERLAQ